MSSALGPAINYAAGQLWAFLRQNERAVAAFRRCIAVDPARVAAWRMIGFLCQQDERLHNDALHAFQRSVELAPDDAVSRYNFGFLLHRRGELEHALAQMTAAVGLRPALDQAWYGCGLLLSELGRAHEAVEALKRAVELQPFNGSASYALCQACRAVGDEEGLLAEYRRIGQYDPRTARRLGKEMGLPD
ncbi:tetratricopeptide repeat protein [Methyloversatilis sp. MC4-4]|uniref:tetratricopeptide repeat protein n=1 Tax=Methyloversatilis sp. MC4-4 TaxID=3132824 RepID=UPI003CF71D0C